MGIDRGASGPEQRLSDLDREVFDRAVSIATTQATQNIAAIHRKRLVRQAAIGSFLVSTAVAVVVAWALYQNALSSSHANAVYNCHLVQSLTRPLARFVYGEANLRAQQQHLAVGQKIIKDLSKTVPNRDLTAAQRQVNNLTTQAVFYWEHTIVPQLHAIAAENCSSHL